MTPVSVQSPGNKAHIVPLIVLSQFAGTSLWFAGNAVLNDLQQALHLENMVVSHVTSAVQFGFITGTLVFALLTISDRFSPSKVFFACALAGAATNVGVLFLVKSLPSLLFFRALTGFFLAGIYPVGMKIAADYHEKGLGKSLGYLVGALVLGTAFPHLLKTFTSGLSWQYVFVLTSIFAAVGGILVLLFIADGPHRSISTRFDPTALFRVFQNGAFRSAAFGYFGHMWELYTFWALLPILLHYYNGIHPESPIMISFWSFLIIASGAPACVIGGYISQKIGSGKVAFVALLSSGVCCLLSPLLFTLPSPVFLGFLLFWGMTVVADSPQFSTLVAQRAPKAFAGTALTISTSIGFAITIVSMQTLQWLSAWVTPQWIYLFLLAGPVFGLLALYKYK
ncbi:MAG: MFS transporter [Saprospiraceae bacterium]